MWRPTARLVAVIGVLAVLILAQAGRAASFRMEVEQIAWLAAPPSIEAERAKLRQQAISAAPGVQSRIEAKLKRLDARAKRESVMVLRGRGNGYTIGGIVVRPDIELWLFPSPSRRVDAVSVGDHLHVTSSSTMLMLADRRDRQHEFQLHWCVPDRTSVEIAEPPLKYVPRPGPAPWTDPTESEPALVGTVQYADCADAGTCIDAYLVRTTASQDPVEVWLAIPMSVHGIDFDVAWRTSIGRGHDSDHAQLRYSDSRGPVTLRGANIAVRRMRGSTPGGP